MPFTEDLSLFFATDDFASRVLYGGNYINGIFDREYVNTERVEGERPILVCAEADVPNISHGEVIAINSIAYTVVEVQPDGTGVVLLILSE